MHTEKDRKVEFKTAGKDEPDRVVDASELPQEISFFDGPDGPVPVYSVVRVDSGDGQGFIERLDKNDNVLDTTFFESKPSEIDKSDQQLLSRKTVVY